MSDPDTQLEAAFGGPSDDAFGSAVFRRTLSDGDDLDAVARDVYREFVGELWDRFGAEAWLGGFAELAARETAAEGSVIDLLGGLKDANSSSAADMLVNDNPDPEAAGQALVAAFDGDGVGPLKIFSLGDGDAMSGLMIAARARETPAATFLVFLMD